MLEALIRWRVLPPGTHADGAVVLAARTTRAFGDGFVSVLLPAYLLLLGLNEVEIGTIASATLAGSALLSLVVGMSAVRAGRRTLLMGASLLMAATGIGFGTLEHFWPLLLVAFVGTINPSAGDVSVFVPLEQSVLPQTVPERERTSLFARYSLLGALSTAFGALSAGVPVWVAVQTGLTEVRTFQGMFILYGLLGVGSLLLFRRLSPRVEVAQTGGAAPLRESRRMVYILAALFSLDNLGTGFIVHSLQALWLFERFGLSTAETGVIFFWMGLLTTASYLMAPWLARRVGLIRALIFTHLPANLAMALIPFMPTLPLALVFLGIRSALSQIDVPLRASYVMAVVPPEERPAAASLTNAPRSLASALTPALAGYMLSLSSFGWPFVCAGVLKGIYDVILWRLFASVRPPEEQDQADLVRARER